MEEVYTFQCSWESLFAASPEAVEASRKHWYTVPGASKSGFYESELPDHAAAGWDVVMDEFIKTHTARANAKKRRAPSLGGLELAFTMCQLAQSQWYAHMSLPELAAKAEQFLEKRTDAAERKRKLEAKTVGHPALADAYGKGMDAVYNLAGLSPTEARVAEQMMRGDTADQIAHTMGYRNADSAFPLITRVNRKLNKLKEEVA